MGSLCVVIWPRVPQPEGEELSGRSSLGARTPSSVLESDAHLHRWAGIAE